MISKDQYAEAFRAADITSPAMTAAIDDWFNLYYGLNIPDGEDPCQQVPYTIVRKLTKTTFSEYTPSSDDEFA